MSALIDVVDFVSEKFGLEVECELTIDCMNLRIAGIDNMSLARYIRDAFPEYEVSCKEVEGYKISNTGWIKIECGSSISYQQTGYN